MQSAKRTAEFKRHVPTVIQSSVSRTQLQLRALPPAINRWATVNRPLTRTERLTFCANLLLIDSCPVTRIVSPSRRIQHELCAITIFKCGSAFDGRATSAQGFDDPF